MKRLVWFVPAALVLALLWLNSNAVTAEPNGTVTLDGREKLKVVGIGCKLTLTVNGVSYMLIQCKPQRISTSVKERVQAPNLVVVMEPGERIRLLGNMCALTVSRRVIDLIKIRCAPLPTPTVTPTLIPTPTRDPWDDS